MSADTRAAFLKLRIQLSKEDVNSALRSIRTLQHEYEDLDSAQEAVRGSNIRSVKVIGQAAQGYKAVATEAKKAKKEIKDAANEQKGFLSGDLQKRLSTARTENRAESFAIRGALGAIPGGGGALGGAASEIFNLIDAIPELNLSFEVLKQSIRSNIAELGAGGVGLIGAMAALAAAVAFFNSQNEKATVSVRTLIATQEEYYKVVATGTRAQLEDARAKAAAEADVLRARVEENRRLFAAFEQEVGGVGRAIADAFNLAGAKELREETQRLEAELQQAEFLESRYTAALENNATAVADATAQFEELMKQFHALQDLRVNTTISAIISASKLTEDQAKERLDAIRLETKTINDQLSVQGQSEENLQRLRDRLHELSIESEVLNDAMQQIKARDLAEDFKELAKIEQEVAELQAEHNDKIKDLNQERLDAELEAYRDHADAIAEAIRDANNARAEAERDRDIALGEAARDAAIEREELERDHQKNLAKIQREFARSREQAIEDRDAVALAEATRKRKEDERDEQDSYKERQRQLEKNLQEENRKINLRYQEQIRNIDMRLAEQVRLIDMRYQEQLQNIYIANQRALQAEQERYAKEYQAKINAVNALLGIEQQGVQSTLALHTQFWQYAVQLAKNAGLNIASAYTGKPPLPSGAGSPPTSPGYKGTNPYISPPQLASGGYIQREGLAYLHAGETVIPAKGRGGMTLNLNLNGATMKTVEIKSREQALEVVGIALDELGAA